MERVWSPLPVGNRAVSSDVEAKFIITFGEAIIPALGLLDGVLPFFEKFVTSANGFDVVDEPRVYLEYRLWVEFFRHFLTRNRWWWSTAKGTESLVRFNWVDLKKV